MGYVRVYPVLFTFFNQWYNQPRYVHLCDNAVKGWA